MKKCPYCNTQINDDSLFCTECGKPIPEVGVNEEPIEVIEDSVSSKWRIIIPLLLGLVLIALIGGWYYIYSSNNEYY